jgi:Cdc6-like AAA superfamily ATPase
MLAQAHVFDEGWVPEDLAARDGETTAIAAALSPMTHGHAPNPVLLSGPPGVGKTATSRWVLEDLDHETPARTTLIDCWTNHRPYQVYAELLQGLGRPGVVQPKTPQRTLRDRVRSALPDGGCVVVLDEADQLDDPSLISDFNAMDGVALILILNDAQRFQDRLQRESISLELAETITYTPYSDRELVSILQPRARRGLTPGAYRRQRLEDAAELADGNARVAIQTIKAAADHARNESHAAITPDDVQAGHAEAVDLIRRKTRSRLQRHERIVLEVLEDLGEAGSQEIHEEYVTRVGEEDARGRRRIRDYLGKLESYNLIDVSGETRGRTYQPTTTAPPDNLSRTNAHRGRP